MKVITKLRANQSGATAIEYGLLVALIAILAISSLGSMSGFVNDATSKVADGMNDSIEKE